MNMKANTPLQKAILKAWTKTKVVHPSLREIAQKVGCSTETVFVTLRKNGLKAGQVK